MSEKNLRQELTEYPAVKTTIVGGRPPGSGKMLGAIPRGIEVLVKKASVDPAFKSLLMSVRSKAADEIGLALDAAEAVILDAVPAQQLEAIIARTHVDESRRSAFLGKAAAVMLVALGASAVPSAQAQQLSKGERADLPVATQPAQEPPMVPVAGAVPRPIPRPPTTQPTSSPASQPASQPAAGETPVVVQPPVMVSFAIRAGGPLPIEPPASTQPYDYPKVDAEKVRAIVPKLDAEDFKDREAAQKELIDIGLGAVPVLQEALKDPKLSLEVQTRLKNIVAKLEATTRPAPVPPREVIMLGVRPVGP